MSGDVLLSTPAVHHPPPTTREQRSMSDRLKRDSPTPALLRNTVFARWDSVTGPTVVKAWPELAQTGSLFAGNPELATEPTVLTTEVARFIARNCLTAEVTNSASFANRVNSRVFTVPEVGLVAYAIAFACVPMKMTNRTPKTSRRGQTSSSAPVVFVPSSGSYAGNEQLCVWFFLFDAAITRVIEMRTVLEETLISRYIYLLRVALTRGLENNMGDARELVSSLPTFLMEMLDSHAVGFEKIFTAFAACSLLPAIRFNSTAFAVHASEEVPPSPVPPADEATLSPTLTTQSSQVDGQQEKKLRPASWFWGNAAGDTSMNAEEQRFIRRAIAATLASGGRALVLGQSSKSINAMVHTLAMFLPLHCRRLCRLAAARPNETFLPGFYIQGLVSAPYPTATELLMSPHALAIINTHDRTVCRTPSPAKHRLASAAFTAARIRDAWEGIDEDADAATTSLGSLSLSDNIPDEALVGDFIVKLSMCSPVDNNCRHVFVESTVADFYTRACCLMQLVQRSLEQQTMSDRPPGTLKEASSSASNNNNNSNGASQHVAASASSSVVLTRREIGKLLDLHKPDGDLAVLVGVGELLQPGFADLFERCPP